MGLEHDRLLAWLSARGAASSEAVMEACKVLATRSARHIRSPRMEMLEPLRRLGHVERDRQRRGWRVVTPTVLWRGLGDGRGLICGARDHYLESEISTQFGARFERAPDRNGPERWSLRGDRGEIQRQARDLGLRWAPDRIPALLAALPTTEAAIRALPEQEYLVCAFARRQWKRFALSGTRPVWRTVEPRRLDENRGLMRSREPGQQEWWLWIEEDGVPADSDGSSALAAMRARRLASLEHQRLARWRVIKEAGRPCSPLRDRSGNQPFSLAWSSKGQQLDVPRFRGAPLPHLLDRGLCLLAGHCPLAPLDEGSGSAIYEGVSRPIAESVARILGIPLLDRS
jgi:hypothetical protein